MVNKWLKRIRGALGMGLTWAAGWAIAGIVIGFSSILLPFLPWDSFFEVFDAPLPALAIPGFVGGALFSIVLGIVGHNRSFHELSLARFAAWGAAGGVLLTLFPFALVAARLASTESGRFDAWQILSVISGPFIFLSTVSAVGSLMLARRAESRGLPGASGENAESLRSHGGGQTQLGAADLSSQAKPAVTSGAPGVPRKSL